MLELSLRHHLGDLDIDLAFASDARTLALFGHSGAGKTSVLNAIAGLLVPGHGRVVLDGRVLLDSAAGISVPVAQRHLGYVFQDGRLFPHLSVRANLLYGAAQGNAEHTHDFAAIVELLALAPLLERRPNTLSGGERQRVAIGRALMCAPRALLLDEPLTGLHAQARSQVLAHLRALKQELRVFTVLVSHHADEVAMLADEVVELAAGCMVAQMPARDFLRRHGSMRTPAVV
ncbi:MAG: ATP-binding cassette domain-containing protein [Dokdonella sp.]|uniref:ATP-binding cassette domain-containing protein n=1 Tax=Dokdonella sp. TaxID=2291710 RepID=UPI0025BC3324|nr:ATP-binding cassette domain-containing protein [Dokdonella sp.]MBZ0221720.1 ATP-binding cassette domain-containing protein [Dokdonella sp.]